jgi:hypothetical protein
MDARAWIEIDPQLVRMVEIAGTYGMRVQLNAAQVDNPGQPGRIIDHDFFRSAPRRE